MYSETQQISEASIFHPLPIQALSSRKTDHDYTLALMLMLPTQQVVPKLEKMGTSRVKSYSRAIVSFHPPPPPTSHINNGANAPSPSSISTLVPSIPHSLPSLSSLVFLHPLSTLPLPPSFSPFIPSSSSSFLSLLSLPPGPLQIGSRLQPDQVSPPSPREVRSHPPECRVGEETGTLQGFLHGGLQGWAGGEEEGRWCIVQSQGAGY